MIHLIHLPVLLADGLGYDFPDVFYENIVETLSTDEARVTNVLSGPDADLFAQRVVSGNGVWTSEVRSPQALFSKSAVHHHGQEGVKFREKGEAREWEYRVRWDSSMCAARTFIVTQMVTAERMLLPRKILSPVWADGAETLTYPAGRVVARGKVYPMEDAVSSILEFAEDPTMRDGEMRVSGPTAQWHFQVFLTKQTLLWVQSGGRRDILMTALVGALSRLDERHSPDESQILGEIASLLAKGGVADWRAEEDYDPAAAATCLEPFLLPAEGDVW